MLSNDIIEPAFGLSYRGSVSVARQGFEDLKAQASGTRLCFRLPVIRRIMSATAT
jgi:hypothetical protein